MNLSQIVQVIRVLAGDLLPDKTFTPESMSLLLKTASLKQFKKKTGLPERYMPGNPIPPEVIEITQKNKADLSPFLVLMGDWNSSALAINIKTGYADKPDDLYLITSIVHKRGWKDAEGNVVTKYSEVKLRTDSQWADEISSVVICPTIEYPIANIQSDFIRFMPRNLYRVDMTYYRLPKDPVFGYVEVNGFFEYNAATSVELEWDEINQIDIIYLVLNDLAVPIEKPDIWKVTDQVKKTGI